MYQPKIRKDLVLMLRELSEVTEKPITTMVDEWLRPRVTRSYEQAFNVTLPRQLELFPVKETNPIVEVAYSSKRVLVSAPDVVFELCKDMRSLQQERVDVLTLNTKNHVTTRKTVFLGALNASLIHPREIYAIALEQRAASIIIVHNHPSGVAEPSEEDYTVTEEIKKAGQLIKIPLLDHIIIGESFYSFKQQQLL